MFHWSDKVKSEFYDPQNVGELDTNKADVQLAEIKTPDGFTHMQLFVEIKQGIITDVKYKVLGCPCCIACLSFVSRQLLQQAQSKLQNISAQDIIQALDLPKERYSSALLVEELLDSIPLN